MVRSFTVSALIWLTLLPPAVAQQTASAITSLQTARSLRCQFPSEGIVVRSDGTVLHLKTSGTEAIFDSIDHQHNRARLIGSIGATDVTVIVGSGSLTFVELSATGNPHITVVFARLQPGMRELVATDSEEFRDPVAGATVVSQYFGSCKVLE